MNRPTSITVLVIAAISLAAPARADTPITLDVDARDVAQKVLHTKLTIPVTPGRFVLAYPKWLPGEHGPNGPINSMTELHITAGNKQLTWTRDPIDMYELSVDVPAGATSIAVSFDSLSPLDGNATSGASMTPSVAVVSWNQVVLFPHGKSSDSLTVNASVRLPTGWKYGSALTTVSEAADRVVFAPASLTTLVDSPVLTSAHLKIVPLTTEPPTRLVIGADSDVALDIPAATTAAYKKLVVEADTLFGAHHFHSYTFLLMLSDHVSHGGLEHHESSDDRMSERALVDDDQRLANAGLMPHEMTHSWNGKFRRPAGLQPGSFELPMNDELLWVYEGLTMYLGLVLTARSGLETAEQFRDHVALIAAQMELSKGRSWRSLADTAVAAQLLYGAPAAGMSARRSVDFYGEGVLIWLEVDTLIRQKTGGKKSIEDFCRLFHGGKSGASDVIAYGFDDVVKALNQVVENDWRGFLTTRLTAVGAHAPMRGLEAAGWTLGFGPTPSPLLKAFESTWKFVDETSTLGVVLNEESVIVDVVPGSPAALAGVPPGAKLIAVNGRKQNTERLRDAVRESKKNQQVDLSVETAGEFYRTYKLDYAGGARYPRLDRRAGASDVLSTIIAPLTKP